MLDINSISICKLKKMTNHQLQEFAAKVRKFLISIGKSRPIHLSSNLGIVEISLGLLKNFDSPIDKIIYDTGHQTYTHKILTGRAKELGKIREFGGPSGFSNLFESEHDVYLNGHTGTAIAIAHGINSSYDNDKNKPYTIAVVGDSAISNGESFESLNNISKDNKHLIIVLNDNGISISKSVGKLSTWFSNIRLNPLFHGSEQTIKKILTFKNKVSKLFDFIKYTYDSVERKIIGNNLFTCLGYQYIGPFDGNDIKKVSKALKIAKSYSEFGPVVVHFKTQKGLGLDIKGQDPSDFHSSLPEKGTTAGQLAADYFEAKLKTNSKLRFINPAMVSGSGFKHLFKSYPKYCYDSGISEEHTIDFALGLAIGELTPICQYYSTFIQRSYDQINQEISRLNKKMIFLIDRCGLSGYDGDSHHGIYDFGILKDIPNILIVQPRNYNQLKTLIELGLLIDKPLFIRYEKYLPIISDYCNDFVINDSGFEHLIKNSGAKTAILTYGSRCEEIAKAISNKQVDLINCYFLNCYNKATLLNILKKYDKVIVYELVAKGNNLASDCFKLAQINKLRCNIISKCYRPWIGHGKVEMLDKEQKMTINDLLKEI